MRARSIRTSPSNPRVRARRSSRFANGSSRSRSDGHGLAERSKSLPKLRDKVRGGRARDLLERNREIKTQQRPVELWNAHAQARTDRGMHLDILGLIERVAHVDEGHEAEMGRAPGVGLRP